MLTLAPSHNTPTGYLLLEQFNECGVLPDRFGRVPHSLKVSSRAAWRLRLAVDVRLAQRVVPVRGADWYGDVNPARSVKVTERYDERARAVRARLGTWQGLHGYA